MRAAGADTGMIYRIDAETADGMPAGLSLPVDTSQLPDVAADAGAAVLMCDPILSLVHGSINPNHAKELRTALEPLRHAAEQAGIAVVGLVHYNKTRDVDANSMIAGSRAWTEVARQIISIAKDEDAGYCVVSQTKNNLGRRQDTSLTYTLVDTVIESEEGEIRAGRLMWGDQTFTSAESILQRKPPTEDRSSADEILRYLADLGSAASPRDIATETGVNYSTAKVTLSRMATRGQIRKLAGGLYAQVLPLCTACGQPLSDVDGVGRHPTCEP